jgi:hypothetical protein
MHPRLSFRLGCFLTKHGKCLQFDVKRDHIFQKLCATAGDIMQLIPFVHAFYAFESFMHYNHHNYESNVTIIPFAMGIH